MGGFDCGWLNPPPGIDITVEIIKRKLIKIPSGKQIKNDKVSLSWQKSGKISDGRD